MTPGSAVEVQTLSKHYGDVLALVDVSVTIQPGRFLVLLGPSGSGKSTLIRCLAGIERPSAGSISLGGVPVAHARLHTAPERRDLAMVFQDFALWPHMSALENVRFALRRRRLGTGEERRRSAAMLARLGLAHKRDRYPHELSGGEQQRVALARALVAEPRLMLFDEPLSSLDAGLRERLRIEIATLVRDSGATAVYITHDQAEAFALGDEVGVLQAGKVIQLGSPENIYRTPKHAFVAHFTGLAGAFRGRLLGDAPTPAGVDQPNVARVRVALSTQQAARLVEVQATATSQLPTGAAVQLLVRPAGARICLPTDPAVTLRGVVRDVAYCGRGYEYLVEIAPGLDLVGVFDERRLDRGALCGIELDPRGCLVFADDGTSGISSILPPGALPDSSGQPAQRPSVEPDLRMGTVDPLLNVTP